MDSRDSDRDSRQNEKKMKPKGGKFTKWKESVAKCFNQIDEKAAEYMYFEISGVDARVCVSYGQSPF